MPNQALRPVLRADADAADARVDTIRQREIDDAKGAAERHAGFCAPVGQWPESRAATAREDDRHRLRRQLMDGDFVGGPCGTTLRACAVTRHHRGIFGSNVLHHDLPDARGSTRLTDTCVTLKSPPSTAAPVHSVVAPGPAWARVRPLRQVRPLAAILPQFCRASRLPLSPRSGWHETLHELRGAG